MVGSTSEVPFSKSTSRYTAAGREVGRLEMAVVVPNVHRQWGPTLSVSFGMGSHLKREREKDGKRRQVEVSPPLSGRHYPFPPTLPPFQESARDVPKGSEGRKGPFLVKKMTLSMAAAPSPSGSRSEASHLGITSRLPSRCFTVLSSPWGLDGVERSVRLDPTHFQTAVRTMAPGLGRSKGSVHERGRVHLSPWHHRDSPFVRWTSVLVWHLLSPA